MGGKTNTYLWLTGTSSFCKATAALAGQREMESENTVNGIRGLTETYFVLSGRMSANSRGVETAGVNGSDQTGWLPTARYR